MQITVKLPDGSSKSFPKAISAFELADNISKSLSKSAIVAKINGELFDLSHTLKDGDAVEIITLSDNNLESLEIIRHDTAHIMAEAVLRLYKDVQVTIGPVIENGFYYDFEKSEPFSEKDLEKIEQEMHKIVNEKHPIERRVVSRAEALEFFKNQGQRYKIEIINDLPEQSVISLYSQGGFTDLCLGPHSPNTSFSKHFKLTKCSGSYWRGNSNNQQLQRIYGTAWASKEALENYLAGLKRAEEIDHRNLGSKLKLFHMQEEAVGSVFWHPKGYTLYLIMEDYIRNRLKKHGYQEIKTPILLSRELWEASGHWEKFQENMFITESSDNKPLALKPMNCPGHVQIFKSDLRSYRNLPIRYAEFGCCHRNEPSGALHGLMRVRNFTQDDAHIFCTLEQTAQEIKGCIDLMMEVYKDFGFEKVRVKFSDRPQKRAGSDEVWDHAEEVLKGALESSQIEYSLNRGEGAFYGPKLEFVLTDALQRDWQCGTIQLDFVLPERLGASYISSDGSKQIPVMVHRAILGSIERFIGIVLENTGGNLPLWLSPVQIAVTSITQEVSAYAKQVHEELEKNSIRSIIDNENDTINYKLRHYMLEKIPYVIIIGKKEANEGIISVRKLGNNESISYNINDFMAMVKNIIDTKSANY